MQAPGQVLLWEEKQVFIASALGPSLNLWLLWEAPSQKEKGPLVAVAHVPPSWLGG